jgi:hypothetical protein
MCRRRWMYGVGAWGGGRGGGRSSLVDGGDGDGMVRCGVVSVFMEGYLGEV